MPKLDIKCGQISKTKFLKVIEDIYDYCYTKNNNLKEFLKLLDSEICELDNITC